MTSCDNHESSTSFNSSKMTKKKDNNENKNKTSDLSFVLKLGQRTRFVDRKLFRYNIFTLLPQEILYFGFKKTLEFSVSTNTVYIF